MTPEYIAIIIMAPMLAYLAVRFLFQKDQAIIARRKAAAQLAAKLSAAGLTELPKLLQEYSVGDYAGLAAEIDRQVVLFLGGNGDAQVTAELQKSFDSVLNVKLATADGRAAIQAALAKPA